jgi:hypothetical protein
MSLGASCGGRRGLPRARDRQHQKKNLDPTNYHTFFYGLNKRHSQDGRLRFRLL